MNVEQTKPVENPAEGTLCPECGHREIETLWESRSFPYGVGAAAVDLDVRLPVRKCRKCGFLFFDDEAEDLRHERVCRHLGVMTPAEILALREKLGLSRAEFARLTRLGEATIARWERAELIQNAGYDSLLWLLQFEENVDRLRKRAEPAAEASDPLTPAASDLSGSVASDPFPPGYHPFPACAFEFGMHSYRLILAEPAIWPGRKKPRRTLRSCLRSFQEALTNVAGHMGIDPVVYMELRRKMRRLWKIPVDREADCIHLLTEIRFLSARALQHQPLLQSCYDLGEAYWRCIWPEDRKQSAFDLRPLIAAVRRPELERIVNQLPMLHPLRHQGGSTLRDMVELLCPEPKQIHRMFPHLPTPTAEDIQGYAAWRDLFLRKLPCAEEGIDLTRESAYREVAGFLIDAIGENLTVAICWPEADARDGPAAPNKGINPMTVFRTLNRPLSFGVSRFKSWPNPELDANPENN